MSIMRLISADTSASSASARRAWRRTGTDASAKKDTSSCRMRLGRSWFRSAIRLGTPCSCHGVSTAGFRACWPGVFEETLDQRLGKALGYLFEPVTSNDDGGVQPTYDLSVPDNVTYVANGMVSHNTIGLMMDCDTTGIEPDLALVKFKKLVGGGSMQIVNQTVPRALKNLGYQPEQAEAITEYIAEHGHVVDAPGLKLPHYEVFDCAMGERAISPMGHVRMMAAVQPLLRRDQQDGQHAGERDRRGHRGDLLRGLEARPQGARDLPRQLQGRPAAVGLEGQTDVVADEAGRLAEAEHRPIRRKRRPAARR